MWCQILIAAQHENGAPVIKGLKMVQVRTQGRPVRGDAMAGRDWLIQKTRIAMKFKPRIDMQRREIAEFAGVTPALVSYYFPDKGGLFEAAAKPFLNP